jgi:hypothetical protein
MDNLEYLVTYGFLGDLGRFRAARPLRCRRGDRVVVRTERGVEIGQVLRPAMPGHAPFMPNTSVGSLLRLVGPEDERTREQMHARAQQLFQRGRELIAELALPLELLDVEVLLDGQHGALHHLRGSDCDVRPLVSALAREFDLHILLTDLTRLPGGSGEVEEEEHGCGREGCGRETGGCSSCGLEGGCGSCGMATPEKVPASFAPLQDKLEARTSLL